MKLLFSLIIFQIFTTITHGQIVVELYFKSDCDNSIKQLEFDLLTPNDSLYSIQSKNGIANVSATGRYLMTSYHPWANDRIGLFSQAIIITDSIKYMDTLNIPKIKFTWDGVLHGSGYWNYFKCDKLCDGLEIDFYPNGQKRTEGEFKHGKPDYIIEYRQNGTKEVEYQYIAGTTNYSRVNYFDKSGSLDEYDLYKRKSKRKTIKTTFTSTGQQIEREIIRHTIVK